MPSVSSQIAYLRGGEQPTAALMNALHMTLDRKLTKLLSGKSPIIAQAGAFPSFLLGKCFFFTSGGAVYALNVPGYQSNSSIPLDGGGSVGPGGLPYPPGYVPPSLPVARPYNPWQCTVASGGPYSDEFTTAINAMVALNATTPGTITFDEVNRIANLTGRFPSASGDGGHYPIVAPSTMGLPCYATSNGPAQNVGYLENSMIAHYILHQGASDTAPVPYYIKEGPCAVERHSAWGVAEIIIEGPTNVTLPDTWDKYNFFRVHNLNSVACTVSFGRHFTLRLLPFACATVRRTAPNGNYAKNGSYFFYAQGEDPRFYWFIQTGMGGTNGVVNTSWSWDGRVTDTMAANNLTNPAGLLDWVAFFTRNVDDYPNYGASSPAATIHAGLITDPTIQSNEYAHYKDLFGDPSVSTTLLGDLLHHKGTVYAVQVSKTKIDALSGKGYTQVIKGSFNGYATFIADMAALGVGVTAKTAAGVATSLTDPKGILQLSNANPSAYDVYLVPTGTNFLKRGDVQASMVTLSGSTLYPIESAVFEVDANAMDPGGLNVMNATPNLGVTSNQLVFPPVVTTAANTKSYYDWMSMTGPWTDPAGTPIVVTGPNITTMAQPAWTSAPVMGGIHAVTVASLTSLSWWGGPGNAHYTLSASLQLTPQGLALVWSEQFDGTAPAQPANGGLWQTYQNWTLGNLSLVQNHCIYFRGHGWGYTASKLGSQAAGFLSCREPRYQVGNNFANEANNQKSPGSDFTYGPLDCTKVEVTTLTRNLGVFDWGGSRFWQSKRGGDNLIQLLTALSLPQFNVSAATTDGSGNHVFTLQNFDGTPATPCTMTLPSTWVDNRLGSAWQGLTEGALPVTEGAMPSLCMALLPEMYNHVAATINRASKGVPLDYRALLWNFENHILNFDPRFNPVYPASGAGMGNIGGDSFTYFGGPVPVNQFCSFDSGSVFESFCMAMDIPVLGTADFPDQDIIAAGHRTTAAIMADQVSALASNTVIDLTNATYRLNPITGNLTGFSCPGCPISCDVSVNISTELLKNGLLLKGMPSGSLCCGTFDPNALQMPAGPPGAPYGPPANGGAVFPPNPLPGNYVVAVGDADGTNTTVGWGTIRQGDLMFPDGHTLALGGNVNDATDPTGAVWNLVSSFTAASTDASGNPTTVNYRWLAQADVERFMLTQGFTLNLEEVYIPLTLTYLEDPFVISQSAASKTIHNVVVNAMFSGDTTELPTAIALLNSRTASLQQVVQLANEGDGTALKPSGGTWLGWYVDVGPDPESPAVMNANWKLLNTNASSGNFASFYAPLPVTDVKSRLNHSNLCRCLEAYGALGGDAIMAGGAGFYPDSTMLSYYGFGFGGGNGAGMAVVDLVLSAGFGSNSADPANNINPGQAPSAANVAFLSTEYILAGADGTPFMCMGRAIIGQGVGMGAYQEYDNHDNYDAYVLHTFGLPRTVSVSLVGQPSWICSVDCWAGADGIAILDGLVWGLGGPGFGISGGLLPWTALPAPADVILGAGATNPTPNGGSDICTILTTPGPQQRYTALFNLARVAIDLTVGTTPSTTQLLASSSQFASSSQQVKPNLGLAIQTKL